MIGVFTVPMGDIMQDLIKERREETGVMEELILKLDSLLKQDLAV